MKLWYRMPCVWKDLFLWLPILQMEKTEARLVNCIASGFTRNPTTWLLPCPCPAYHPPGAWDLRSNKGLMALVPRS